MHIHTYSVYFGPQLFEMWVQNPWVWGVLTSGKGFPVLSQHVYIHTYTHIYVTNWKHTIQVTPRVYYIFTQLVYLGKLQLRKVFQSLEIATMHVKTKYSHNGNVAYCLPIPVSLYSLKGFHLRPTTYSFDPTVNLGMWLSFLLCLPHVLSLETLCFVN